MVATEAVDTKAPEGTYQALLPVKDIHLGNAYTKRLIRAVQEPEVWQHPYSRRGLETGDLVVQVRFTEGRQRDVHYFGIDARDQVVSLESVRQDWSVSPIKETPIDMPPPSVLLKEIEAARRIQPTLKR